MFRLLRIPLCFSSFSLGCFSLLYLFTAFIFTTISLSPSLSFFLSFSLCILPAYQPKGGVKIAADEAEAKKNGGAVAASLPENSDDLIPMIRDVCRVLEKKSGDLIDS